MRIKEFKKKLENQKSKLVKKYRDLEDGEIYVITNVKRINEKSAILTIEKIGKVWAPSNFLERIKGHELPIYLHKKGMKHSEKNKDWSYFEYDLVFSGLSDSSSESDSD